MEQFEIVAAARDAKGKGASRRLRRTGYIPGILYGAGIDPVNIQLEHNDVIKHTDVEAFYSHILTLKLPSGAERVVLKDLQRHPDQLRRRVHKERGVRVGHRRRAVLRDA